MNPLDLLNVKFQVSTRGPECGIWRALCDIHAIEGWRRLYRGLSPNVAGNAGGWGFYFLLYNQLERRATVDAPDNLSVSQYRLFSAGASSHSCFFLPPNARSRSRTLARCRDGQSYKPDLGVKSSDDHCATQLGVLQAQERVPCCRSWHTSRSRASLAFELKRRRVANLRRAWTTDVDKLVFPGPESYQVIRSHIHFPSDSRACHRRPFVFLTRPS
ncbi:hypothetical protein EDB83DRAFT_2433971 [Lactarius deliciosus]|nr:hypothetical protein EDB83DRAFT_2433971 [Lactarius deliciosus]